MSTWSEWRPVEPQVTCSEIILAELLDGGQAFRWNQVNGVWRGVWGNCVAEIEIRDNRVHWRTPSLMSGRVEKLIAAYLSADDTYALVWDELPHRSDPVLFAAMEQWPKLRILKQPFGETLLCFLCSSMKQIITIKQLCETLAERFGRELIPGIYALPTWMELHHVSESDLRSAGLGYRARYVHAISHHLAGQPSWLDVVEELPYLEAKARLMELPGVGAKIADCTLLFGAARLEAFPVDTWIARVMTERYRLDGWSIEQVAHFGRLHFGRYAGLAQQYLFSSARRG